LRLRLDARDTAKVGRKEKPNLWHFRNIRNGFDLGHQRPQLSIAVNERKAKGRGRESLRRGEWGGDPVAFSPMKHHRCRRSLMKDPRGERRPLGSNARLPGELSRFGNGEQEVDRTRSRRKGAGE